MALRFNPLASDYLVRSLSGENVKVTRVLDVQALPDIIAVPRAYELEEGSNKMGGKVISGVALADGEVLVDEPAGSTAIGVEVEFPPDPNIQYFG